MAPQPIVGPLATLLSFLILYTVGRIFGREMSLSQGLVPTHDTAQTQNKHIDVHSSSGIRTRDLSVWSG
jgi:hypothetical protein